ncbi:scyllo-inositol 2-dehydrogenase (NADP+) [Scopulibacillus daqui]|uniref:Scyllo-inositol 2-dehydrogenase (NADP+) n=1 Tax=Scopulibacillus daqui TaxID=1469162 RepID=A0ABS2Q231_9BACL|nr:oxidoreductase [Scopulibacillus daqui]MBM7646176.1 scyllo-inositol 2-dehydrogenase (NADP+) [Scopulibacillus daqui]
MEKIKVGLIGYGFSGATFHAPFLEALEEYDVVKVMSSSKEKVQKDLGQVEVAENLEDILNDQDIELVVITTPNTLHYDMAKQSLLAKKHVIVEKPMVINPSEAEELIQLANDNNLMLSVYQNRRWDNDFLTIKQLITDDALGEINTYEAHFDRFRPEVRNRWREQAGEGSGMLYDLGSHLIDQALHLFGDPKFIMADVFAQRKNAVTDDYFHIIMGYDNLRVLLHSGSIVKGHGPKYEVHGSKGSFIKYGTDGQEAALKMGKKPTEKDWGKDKPEWYGRLFISENGQDVEKTIETVPGSYISYYKQVYRHIREGEPCPVTAEEGLKTIKMIQAAIKSSQEKRAVFLDEN